jgi:hypothetical protein
MFGPELLRELRRRNVRTPACQASAPALVSSSTRPKPLEGGFRTLAESEFQMHETSCCVVDEDQQGTGIAPVFEPAMLAAIDLDQLA